MALIWNVTGHAPKLTGTEEDDYILGVKRAETLEGLGGNDQLVGGHGNDKLYGGEGDDILDGGKNSDYLEGGAGADTFRFAEWHHSNEYYGPDLIADFEAQDKIDISQMGTGPIPVSAISIVEAPNNSKADWQIVIDVAEQGNPEFYMIIDVIGVQPTLDQFII